MTRRRRTVAALFAAFALLFAQFAVSAHACEARARAAVTHDATMHPDACPDAKSGTNLCSQHCQYGDANFDLAKPVPAIDAAVGPVVAVLVAPRTTASTVAVRAIAPAAQGPPPDARPLALRI
jgi:hypothetical protein